MSGTARMTRDRMQEIIFVARLLELNIKWELAVGARNMGEQPRRDRLWLTTKLFKLCGLEGR